jgi:membrane-bound ClpP family serine protease
MLEWFAVLLLVGLGIIFIIVELIFIPGNTIVGVLGLISGAAGIYLGYDYFGNTIGSIILSISVLITAVSVYYSLNSNVLDKFALHNTIESKVNEDEKLCHLKEGDTGIALSNLRPVGNAEFGNQLFVVNTQGGFIDNGQQIRIIKVEGRKIFVEKV